MSEFWASFACRRHESGFEEPYEPVVMPLSMVDWSHEPLLKLTSCDLPQPRKWTLAEIGQEVRLLWTYGGGYRWPLLQKMRLYDINTSRRYCCASTTRYCCAAVCINTSTRYSVQQRQHPTVQLYEHAAVVDQQHLATVLYCTNTLLC